MKRSRPIPLTLFGLFGALLGFVIQLLLASNGRPTLAPPLTLPITLVVVGVLVFVAAWPIHRAVKGSGRREINPFMAARVVVLAKASSLVGSLAAGFGLGLIIYTVSRPVIPGSGSLWLAIASGVGGVVLLVAGLVAEHLCALPPDDPATPKES